MSMILPIWMIRSTYILARKGQALYYVYKCKLGVWATPSRFATHMVDQLL